MDSYGIDLTRLTPKYKEVAIFTSTFNLGECDLASIGDVGQWVPHGYEVYVIGLQVGASQPASRHWVMDPLLSFSVSRPGA